MGAAGIVVNNLANSVVQALAPDELRGRVMGVYALSFFGFLPLGSLLAGSVAASLGAPTTVLLGGLGTLLCAAAVTAVVPDLRRPV
jgi:dipeptide/tripeptide permease